LLFHFKTSGGDMKLILNIGGFAVIYLGGNSLEIGDYVTVMAGALCVYVSGVLSS
jgi:hypothetical protein